jgi:hypothetical protein
MLSGGWPTRSPSTQVQNQSSKMAAAISSFSSGSRALALALIANDDTNRLLVCSSADGRTWSASTQVPDQASKAAPSLAVYDDKLWLAFVANNSTNQLLVCSSADGRTWSASTQVPDQESKAAAPALVGLQG